MPVEFHRARKWQQRFIEVERHTRKIGQKVSVLYACVGSGKSTMAAWVAADWLDDGVCDFVLAVAPWKSIVSGIQEAFYDCFGLETQDRFYSRKNERVPVIPPPAVEGIVTTYHEVCRNDVISQLRYWKENSGVRFGLILDEVHHAADEQEGRTWGVYSKQIEELAERVLVMSGTMFRPQNNEKICLVPYNANGIPMIDGGYEYKQAVLDRVVRPVTMRWVDPQVEIFDADKNETTSIRAIDCNEQQFQSAKKEIFKPDSESVVKVIEYVHQQITWWRDRAFPDAAGLFIAPRGKTDSSEDSSIFRLAKTIKQITGVNPVTVTHKDRDAAAKIKAFKRGGERYIVAIDMFSEGMDCPRLRAVGFCRYITTKLLFTQIIGRVVRVHSKWPGDAESAACVALPRVPGMTQWAEEFYEIGLEALKERQPPPESSAKKTPTTDRKERYITIDEDAGFNGGRFSAADVEEDSVVKAELIKQLHSIHRCFDTVQLAHALQAAFSMQQSSPRSQECFADIQHLRENLRKKIRRNVQRIASRIYKNEYALAWSMEVHKPFGITKLEEIETWSVDRVRELADYLKDRVAEAYVTGR